MNVSDDENNSPNFFGCLWNFPVRCYFTRYIKYPTMKKVKTLLLYEERQGTYYPHLAYSWLDLASTRNNEALSASTSFWAWFIICTINVSILIISWNIDL